MVIHPRDKLWCIYRWRVCLSGDIATVRRLDGYARSRTAVNVKQTAFDGVDHAAWHWVKAGTEAFECWRLYHMAQNWPAPAAISSDGVDGYWFPAPMPPSAERAEAAE